MVIYNMTSEELAELCKSIYGAQSDWKTKLAAEIGVSLRTVERWATGLYPIPERQAHFIVLSMANIILTTANIKSGEKVV